MYHIKKYVQASAISEHSHCQKRGNFHIGNTFFPCLSQRSLSSVKSDMFSHLSSTHSDRWRFGYQPYALTMLYSPEALFLPLVLISVTG
jgi:hypothetical protein